MMIDLSTQTEPLQRVERTGRARSWVVVIVTNLISLACLWWVLSGAALPRIWGEIRLLRWNLLLCPVAPVRFTSAVEAIYVGLFSNEVLPFRAGELIRCFLLSKSSKI